MAFLNLNLLTKSDLNLILFFCNKFYNFPEE